MTDSSMLSLRFAVTLSFKLSSEGRWLERQWYQHHQVVPCDQLSWSWVRLVTVGQVWQYLVISLYNKLGKQKALVIVPTLSNIRSCKSCCHHSVFFYCLTFLSSGKELLVLGLSVGRSVCRSVHTSKKCQKNFKAWKWPFWANLRKRKLLRIMIGL